MTIRNKIKTDKTLFQSQSKMNEKAEKLNSGKQ